MTRREFIMLLGGTAAAWPLAARAQQSNRPRRVGVLMAMAPNDPEVQLRVKAFEAGLRELGWNEGRNLIALAARHRLPAVYPYRYFAVSGGLMSYGTDLADIYRRAATYVDRILKGAAAGDLPVQAPTKFDLVINLKTAKELGLDVPPTLIARADEVIE
jgi:ABC-type uncharacterized transport system substrate-binding protein